MSWGDRRGWGGEKIFWKNQLLEKMRLLFLLILASGPALAQTTNPLLKTVADGFQRQYNEGKFDSVFFSFSNSMKDHLPRDETVRLLEGLKRQSGNILSKKLMGFDSGYGLYRATLERGTIVLAFSLDDQSMINGFFAKPFEAYGLTVMDRTVTDLILPFKGVWRVAWGGNTKALNYHVENLAQKDAIDFEKRGENGKSYQTDGRINEDYYAFGQEIIAACDGEVVLVVDGVKDNLPGKINPDYIFGNTVVLKTEKGEFLFFAHLKQHSIGVKQGDRVKQGQLLGLCGNSGNSFEPHLHFHVQNAEATNIATGIKAYFSKIAVDGTIKEDYSPIQGEAVEQVD